VVQEALTNVLKHGTDVSTVAVEMSWSADALAVDICDDGRKRPASGSASMPAGQGHGLTGMRERVALHGGTMFAGPGPHRGWRVHARLPLEQETVQEETALPRVEETVAPQLQETATPRFGEME